MKRRALLIAAMLAPVTALADKLITKVGPDTYLETDLNVRPLPRGTYRWSNPDGVALYSMPHPNYKERISAEIYHKHTDLSNPEIVDFEGLPYLGK